MLVETNMSILEISNQCGFEAVSTFNALIKKHYSKKPSEVRNSARKNSNFSLYLSNQVISILQYN